MLKPILNYIAKHHPKALTETWLNQTEQGHLYRNRHKEPVTKLDLRGKAKAFIDSLPESGWRTTGSPLPFGLRLTGYDLIQQDREILILIHNDKSDIYGVFEKINENRFPVLLDILTAPVERVSAQTISDIEEKLKGIRNDLSEEPVTTAGIAHALHTVALLNKDVKGLLSGDVVLATGMIFPLLDVLSVTTGLNINGMDGVHSVLDFFCPGITQLGFHLVQPKITAEIYRQHPSLQSIVIRPDHLEEDAANATNVFGDQVSLIKVNI